MPNNVYSYLDDLATNGFSQRSLNMLPVVRENIIKFPQSLGDKNYSIPFTIFMPYKRAKGGSGFYSIQNNAEMFSSLPKPSFAIVLPTPTSALKTQYQAAYSPFSFGQALGASGSAGEQLAGLVNKATGGAPKVVQEVITNSAIAGVSAAIDVVAVGAMQASVGLLGADKEAVNVYLGAADNPFTENMFRNMEFREHSFAYTFMPKSPEDSTRIDQIITLFKYGMLPKPGFAGYLDFPFEFQITHSIQDTTFTLLPSVLTSLDVDYGGGADSPKLFRPDSNGKQYPAKITLTMSFKEMVLLTRDKITYDSLRYADDGTEALVGAKRYRF